MRLRRVPRAVGVIQSSDKVIKDPVSYKGHWQEFFGNDNPIHIEIGMGKGRFLMDLAALHPEINYIGIERQDSVLFRAVEKLEPLGLSNVVFLLFNADNLTDIFDKNEISRIYLNFSDPWPKERHAKRRLTSSVFLAKYDTFLKSDGTIEFKTDNRPLFDFSLDSVNENGWKCSLVTYDLHHSQYAEGNIMTEYEERFSSVGNPICKAIFCR